MQQLRADEHLPQISTSDSPELEHPPVIEDRDRADPFTSLLMFYSGKALEFPVLSHSGSSGPPPRSKLNNGIGAVCGIRSNLALATFLV